METFQASPPQNVRDAYRTLVSSSPEQELGLLHGADLDQESLPSGLQSRFSSRPSAALDAEGQCVASTAFVYSTLAISPLVLTEDGREVARLDFHGTAWGLGLGAGTFWTTGWLVPEASRKWKVDYEVTYASFGTNVRFSKAGRWVGRLLGPGIGVGAGIVSGSGEFTRRR